MTGTDAILLRLAELAYHMAEESDEHQIARALGDAGLRRLLEAAGNSPISRDTRDVRDALTALLPDTKGA